MDGQFRYRLSTGRIVRDPNAVRQAACRVGLVLGLCGVLVAESAAQGDEDLLGGASQPRPQMKLTREDGQYKRIHQWALRMMLLDRDQEAREFLDGYLERHPGDEETLLMLGLLHLRRGDTDQAVKTLREAVEAGLPPERILAGPRPLFKPLLATPYGKELQSKLARTPLHGPLVGDVTDQSASFWFRLAGESEVQVELSRTRTFDSIVSSSAVRAKAGDDFTAVCSARKLQPDSTYYYRVRIDGQPATGIESTYQFRTFPARGTPSRFSIAFGGGAGYVPPHERMWNTIQQREPLALLLLGDNTYIDDPESPLMQQYTYQRRQSRPEFRQLTAGTAVFTIWDDHDFGTNDCWGGPLIDRPKWKRDYSWTIFKQNWPNPGFGGGYEQPGCWYSFSIGDVDFIMLDCRYYRTNPRQDQPSMLGPVQMKWLKSELAEASGRFKVICSSVPWDFRTKGDSRDTWNGYQDEREEIFGFINQKRIDGVVLMSADRHRSDAWRIDREDGYPLYEFNSSRLTNQHVHPTMEKRGAIFSYNKKQSFGLITFDTQAAKPTVRYDVYSIDGELIDSLTVERGQLRHR